MPQAINSRFPSTYIHFLFAYLLCWQIWLIYALTDDSHFKIVYRKKKKIKASKISKSKKEKPQPVDVPAYLEQDLKLPK